MTIQDVEPPVTKTISSPKESWGVLILLCLCVFMIVLDGTVVTLALPQIKLSLSLSNSSAVGVLESYLLTYGGFLLLCGRLGDFFGYRRLFLTGLLVFTLASLGCALVSSGTSLVAARVLQGIGGAAVVTSAFSLIAACFTSVADRNIALGVYSFASSSGGAMGLIIGGLLTTELNWRWIFLINIPVGAAAYCIGNAFLPRCQERKPISLDVGGAITITTSLGLTAYGLLLGGSSSLLGAPYRTATVFGTAALFFITFLRIEARAAAPLVPLDIFRVRNLTVCALTGALLSVAGATSIFTSMYLQEVLRCTPWQVGMLFLPSTVISAVFSLCLSAKLVIRFGAKRALIVGLTFVLASLLIMTRTDVAWSGTADVSAGMMILGLGIGIATNPVLSVAMNTGTSANSGLISGIVNTFSMMGSALGLALLSTASTARTNSLLGSGVHSVSTIIGGYHAALTLGAVSSLVATVLVAMLLTNETCNTGQQIARQYRTGRIR